MQKLSNRTGPWQERQLKGSIDSTSTFPSLYSLLFHSEQKCHQKKGQKNVTPLTQPGQTKWLPVSSRSSCLFFFFSPPKSFCFHLLAHRDSIGAGHMTADRSPDGHNQTHKDTMPVTSGHVTSQHFFCVVCMALVSSGYLLTGLQTGRFSEGILNQNL